MDPVTAYAAMKAYTTVMEGIITWYSNSQIEKTDPYLVNKKASGGDPCFDSAVVAFAVDIKENPLLYQKQFGWGFEHLWTRNSKEIEDLRKHYSAAAKATGGQPFTTAEVLNIVEKSRINDASYLALKYLKEGWGGPLTFRHWWNCNVKPEDFMKERAEKGNKGYDSTPKFINWAKDDNTTTYVTIGLVTLTVIILIFLLIRR